MNSFTRSLVGLTVLASVAGMASSPTFAAKADFTVRPVAGRTTTGDDAGRWVGGGADAKAYKNADGSFTLTKGAETSTYAYAALLVGVEGKTLAELGTISYDVDGLFTGGSPRINLTTDKGFTFLSVSDDASGASDGTVTVGLTATGLDPAAKVLSLSIIVDEQGTSTVSNIAFTGLS